MSREGLNRLIREYKMIQKDPIPYVKAVPMPNNWFIWHFVISGLPEDSLYFGGFYHGELRFNSNYPMSPPSIIVHTPNGRFRPGDRICTSMSDFHPETWSPIWRVSTILSGLVSFMQSDERSAGCILSSDAYKRSSARQSLEYNLRQPRFVSLFEAHIPAFKASVAQASEVKENQLITPMKTASPFLFIVAVIVVLGSLLLNSFK